MKLYVLAGACSMVPHVALEWTGVQYTIEIVDHQKIKSLEYLKLNPNGAVPLLVEGDFVLSQNVAILQYLHSTFPAANLFGTGHSQQQALAWHWLAYFNADVHKTFVPIFRADAFISDAKGQKELVTLAKKRLISQLGYPDKALADKEYLTGELTIADIYLYVILRWTMSFEIDFSQHIHLEKFFARVEKDSGVEEVISQEKIEKMAR